MYHTLFEVQIRGMPNELECLTKLRDRLAIVGKCLGSSSMYICFYKSTMIKVMPKTEDSSRKTPIPPYETLQQMISILFSIESNNTEEMAVIVESVYNVIKNCGLFIRLIE